MSDKILEHLRQPHNMEKMKDPDGVGVVRETICEDELKAYIKVRDGRVVDASFEGFACAAALVTSSVATDLVKGRTPEEVLALTTDDVIKELGSLPETKSECIHLGAEAVRRAARDYLEKHPG
ncbi:MAG: iron-sulfur cluster assembly scaffold protein [Euryarchaeota archaeon]|nr:iron-sulfur cluster assembly scaffold protein [Euryarchaeota archaeon]